MTSSACRPEIKRLEAQLAELITPPIPSMTGRDVELAPARRGDEGRALRG